MLKSGLVTIGGRPLHNHEITPYFSCHSERSEESRFSVIQGEILRHVVPQNDKMAPLCRSEQLHRPK